MDINDAASSLLTLSAGADQWHRLQTLTEGELL
jgi:hypothetical protein